MAPPPTIPPATDPRRARFAWQGFVLDLPRRWNPVRLEGTDDAGHVLIADLHGPQLGLRWRRVNARKLDADAWARRAIEAEVGKRFAARAKPLDLPGGRFAGSMICLEDDPPGRDVWVAHSPASGRVVELVHHVQKRDRALQDQVLPALRDIAPTELRPWAIFDLACIVPAGYALKSHRLNAGDVGLTFAARARPLAIRQLALARLALARLPLEKWLAGQETIIQRHYRRGGDAEAIDVAGANGLLRRSTRRRRFAFMRWLPEAVVTLVLHDVARDRLILAQGGDEEAARALAASALDPAPASPAKAGAPHGATAAPEPQTPHTRADD